jgi:putative hydrolase of HD superfamily
MKSLANLLFQANILKKIPRSGFHFLGAGRESVAEHVFSATFIGYVLSQLHPEADSLRLVTMCLVHDLAESRLGDLNAVHKQYLRADEQQAIDDTAGPLPFGKAMAELITEFNAGITLEARLARDADQLALIVDLKTLADVGYSPPHKWLPHVRERLQTSAARELADTVMTTEHDNWWLETLLAKQDRT